MFLDSHAQIYVSQALNLSLLSPEAMGQITFSFGIEKNQRELTNLLLYEIMNGVWGSFFD